MHLITKYFNLQECVQWNRLLFRMQKLPFYFNLFLPFIFNVFSQTRKFKQPMSFLVKEGKVTITPFPFLCLSYSSGAVIFAKIVMYNCVLAPSFVDCPSNIAVYFKNDSYLEVLWLDAAAFPQNCWQCRVFYRFIFFKKINNLVRIKLLNRESWNPNILGLLLS